jgi:TonB family protein
MRRTLVASLLSSLALTAAAATPSHPNDAASTPAAVVVSTGVTQAQLLHSTQIDIPVEAVLDSVPNPAKVVLRVSLDQAGSPTRVQIVQSVNPIVDARVIKAVQQFRWRPAVLDNQTIPIDVNLIVQVQH